VTDGDLAELGWWDLAGQDVLVNTTGGGAGRSQGTRRMPLPVRWRRLRSVSDALPVGWRRLRSASDAAVLR
jgi:hypothetical protein